MYRKCFVRTIMTHLLDSLNYSMRSRMNFLNCGFFLYNTKWINIFFKTEQFPAIFWHLQVFIKLSFDVRTIIETLLSFQYCSSHKSSTMAPIVKCIFKMTSYDVSDLWKILGKVLWIQYFNNMCQHYLFTLVYSQNFGVLILWHMS